MKKIKYLLESIIIPVLLFIGISCYFSSIFEFTDYEGNGFKAKLTELTFNHPRTVSFIVIFVFLLIAFKKYNIKREKEFAPTEQYGNYNILIYYIAWILGYTKVNLKLKPIKLQFQLLRMNRFDYISDVNYENSDNYTYKINRIGNLENTKKINIIVGDTYTIKKSKIPDNELIHYTIDIERNKDNGIRIDSKKLVKILNKEIQKTKKYCKELNLFLATPPDTNMEIYKNIFNTRDGFILNIFQQDNKNDFKFSSKSKRIKC